MDEGLESPGMAKDSAARSGWSTLQRGGANCVCLEERWGVGAEGPPAGEQASWQTPQFPELIPAPGHCSQFCCFNNIIFIHPTERQCLRRGRQGAGLGHGGGGCGITERAWGLESAKTRFGALPPQGDPRAEVP